MQSDGERRPQENVDRAALYVAQPWHRGMPGPRPAAPAQPSPYSESLPKVDLTGLHAFDAVGNWIAASPAARSCWVIDKLNGVWRVGLQQDGERLSAGVGKTLAEAAENAIKIAAAAGCL